MWLLIQTHNVTNTRVIGKDYKSERFARDCTGLMVRALLDEPHLHAP